MDELILVGLDDKEQGSMEKMLVHKLGRLHRAFSVFIVHDGKMLIQKRNSGKYHSGGLWTNACCSHPRKGESLAYAVHRRMQEELGTDCDVEELFSFTYYARFQDDLSEYELDHVFLGDYFGDIQFDPEEIEGVQWIALDDLKKSMEANPERYTVWFMIAAPKVMEMIKEREAQKG